MKLTVITPFKDKVTKELYEPGIEIELTEVDRINDVVARGLCRIVEVDTGGAGGKELPEGKISLFDKEFDRKAVNAALKLVGVKGNVDSFKSDTVATKVAELNEDELKIFKGSLSLDQ